jgi:uncharacterized integral membrane protein (TIGR00697 family)
MTKKNSALMIVTALFVTFYLVSNIMAVKIIGFYDLFYFDAGTITFPFAYMLGDLLTEIWGYRTAKKVIFLIFICNIIMVLCTTIGVLLPYPTYVEETAMAYNHIFTYIPRIIIGSLAGFLFGELSNAWFMAKIKVWTRGKYLWIRTIGSSSIGYLLDTIPFVLIAFGGIAPWEDLAIMILIQYCLKLGIEAFFGTPIAYAAINFIKRKI